MKKRFYEVRDAASGSWDVIDKKDNSVRDIYLSRSQARAAAKKLNEEAHTDE